MAYVIALWWLSGFASFVFWWTKDCDLDLSVLPIGLLAGLIGPVAWVLGWAIHGDAPLPSMRGKVVLLRRRRHD